jgi:transcriptional regulator
VGVVVIYVVATYLAALAAATRESVTIFTERELKRGSAALLVMALLEARPRHGYEIGRLIDERSGGRLRFKVASLYPLLYRLEERGWIAGRWVEKAGERRRRFYRLTAEGRRVLAAQREHWRAFVDAVRQITEADYA